MLAKTLSCLFLKRSLNLFSELKPALRVPRVRFYFSIRVKLPGHWKSFGDYRLRLISLGKILCRKPRKYIESSSCISDEQILQHHSATTFLSPDSAKGTRLLRPLTCIFWHSLCYPIFEWFICPLRHRSFWFLHILRYLENFVAHSQFWLFIYLFNIFHAGDWTQGLTWAGEVSHQWAPSPPRFQGTCIDVFECWGIYIWKNDGAINGSPPIFYLP